MLPPTIRIHSWIMLTNSLTDEYWAGWKTLPDFKILGEKSFKPILIRFTYDFFFSYSIKSSSVQENFYNSSNKQLKNLPISSWQGGPTRKKIRIKIRLWVLNSSNQRVWQVFICAPLAQISSASVKFTETMLNILPKGRIDKLHLFTKEMC